MQTLTVKLRPTRKQFEAYKALENPSIDEIFIGGGAGGGKAQPLDSLILTKNGFIKMGSIKIGDKVLTSNNKEEEVLQIYPQGIKDIYEIEFIDGAKIRVTNEHLFDCWIARKGQSRRKIRSVNEIIKLKGNVIIPLAEKLEFGEKYNGDAYLIGLLLGDGGITKSNIILTTEDTEIFDYINSDGFKIIKKKKYAYSLTGLGWRNNPVLDELRRLKLLGTGSGSKFIPDEIKNGLIIDRLNVLQGLMDTDGYIDSRGHCYFTSKSEQLATDVQYIVRSLGGKATLKEVKKHCFYKGEKKEGIYYCVYINIKDCSEIFKLSRKKNRKSNFNGGGTELGRRIINIKQVGKEKAQCISITGNHLYISDDFVVTHNSWLICESRLHNAYTYPGYRSFIGREELKRLMQSTFITWNKVCQHHKIPREDWKLNGQYNYIEFKNGSRIDLLDLKFLPSDPLYERFGSTEYSDGAIEEAGEVHNLAKDVLKSRIGRHLNKELDIIPNLLVSGNPKKNWTKTEYFNPWRAGELPPNKIFIQSLYSDNPYTSEEYGKQLAGIHNEVMRQRLKDGNWDYDESKDSMVSFDALEDTFSNTITKTDEKYLIIDVARLGKDTTVFSFWEGLELYRIEKFGRQDTAKTIQTAKDHASAERIPWSNIMVDEDGIGGAVVDGMKGVKGFVANSTPLPTASQIRQKIARLENDFVPKTGFKNLKSQCAFKIAELINEHKVAFKTPDYREAIIEELSSLLRQKNIDGDGKLMIKPKEEVKQDIGRSPDIGDTIIYRAWFELKKEALDEDPNRNKLISQQQYRFMTRKRDILNTSNK